MSDSTHLALPYLEAAQAQKHVTVNEALRRLDGVVQLAVADRTLTAPPGSPAEGARYIVGTSATGAWAGADNQIAMWSDGAWMFLTPQTGWRAFDVGASEFVYFDGSVWAAEAGGGMPTSAHGATMSFRVLEADHTLAIGFSNDTGLVIPARAIVFGVTGIVTETILGATSWSLGVAADASRYGSGVGISAGSTVVGPSGPMTYWSDTSLRVTAAGLAFVSGKIRLAIHYATLTGPST